MSRHHNYRGFGNRRSFWGGKKVSLFTVAAVAIISLCFAASAYSAPKLIVKDSLGTTNVFTVDDTGSGYFAGDVAIGKATAAYPLDVNGKLNVEASGTYANFLVTTHSDTGWHSAFLKATRSRGTSSAPSAVQSGNALFSFDIWGYDGTSYLRSAQFNSSVDGPVSTGIIPSKLVFNTTDTNGSLATRMVIRSNGRVGIGTSNPVSSLQVVGYVQLDTTSGTPSAADCSNSSQYGRMIVNPSGSGILWICSANGWTAK